MSDTAPDTVASVASDVTVSAVEKMISELSGPPPAAPTPAPAKAPPPAADPVLPPVPPPAPQKPSVDDAAMRETQARAHADLAAKIERDRVALEAERKALAAERDERTNAARLRQLAKDDPVAFVRETGIEPKEFARRMADRERVSDVARAELSGQAKEVAELRERLAAMETAQRTQAETSAKAARKEALAQLAEVAKTSHPAAAHFLAAQPDDPYIDAVADELRAERGYAPSIAQIAERVDLRVREQARSILATPWGRELAAEIVKAAQPTATTKAPTGQEVPTGAQAPKTLSQLVAADRAKPPRDDDSTRTERALDLFLGSS